MQTLEIRKLLCTSYPQASAAGEGLACAIARCLNKKIEDEMEKIRKKVNIAIGTIAKMLAKNKISERKIKYYIRVWNDLAKETTYSIDSLQKGYELAMKLATDLGRDEKNDEDSRICITRLYWHIENSKNDYLQEMLGFVNIIHMLMRIPRHVADRSRRRILEKNNEDIMALFQETWRDIFLLMQL